MSTGRRDMTEETFGSALRALRERAGISQVELTRRMVERGWSWHQSTVYRIESGRQPMRLAEAVDLADILEVSVDRLTWAGPEINETVAVDAAIAGLRQSWQAVAAATERLQASRAAAQRTLDSSRGSDYQRVADACAELEVSLAGATLDSAVAEGLARYGKPADDAAEVARFEPGRGDAVAPRQGPALVTMRLSRYEELREVGEAYRVGGSIILDLGGMTLDDCRRAVDFVAGMVLARRGLVERVTDRVFVLLAPGVELSADGRDRVIDADDSDTGDVDCIVRYM